jgi:dTDP-4-amino-4,6-dideoxy-D-galactose acyltransferase
MITSPYLCSDAEGAPLCEVLDWDSQFFNRAVAKVCRSHLTLEDAQRVRNWAGQHGIQTVYFLAQLDDLPSAWAAEATGFRFVDIRLTYEHKSPQTFGDSRIRQSRPSDQADLEVMASRSFSLTRFARDPAFGPDGAARLYREWLRKSLSGWAQQTLVAESNGRPAGFVTCHITSGVGSIGLVAVDEKERGKGLGPALVLCANSWLLESGAQSITVVTQGANLAAQRIYEATGFTTKAVEMWFHLTLAQSE